MTTNRNRLVALNVKAAILASGLSIEEAARGIQTPPTTLRRHLDAATITVPELNALSELTGTPATEFFSSGARNRSAA